MDKLTAKLTEPDQQEQGKNRRRIEKTEDRQQMFGKQLEVI